MQLVQLRRTHVVPDDEAALRALGRSMGFLKDPVAGLEDAWRGHRREVRRLHEKLFYLSLIHISEPTRRLRGSRMPSSA